MALGGFRWLFLNGGEKRYEFPVLPVGLNVAGYIFTKTMRPLVTKWRAQGIKSIIHRRWRYRGRGGGGGGAPITRLLPSHGCCHTTAAAASCIKNDLQLAGFLLNRNKT